MWYAAYVFEFQFSWSLIIVNSHNSVKEGFTSGGRDGFSRGRRNDQRGF